MALKTRCPYPTCLEVFEAPSQIAVCPSCTHTISARPLDVLLKLERQAQHFISQDQLAKVDVLERLFTDGRPPRIMAAVEDVRSLWNVGSIFRSADGAGVGRLFLLGITGTPPRKQIEKTSLGAEQVVPWLYASSITEIAPLLRQRGCFLMGLEYTRGLEGVKDSTLLAQELAQKSILTPVCLVVGNEVTGLSPEAMQACDRICHLPMRGKKESLNVSVAFAVAAYLLAERL